MITEARVYLNQRQKNELWEDFCKEQGQFEEMSEKEKNRKMKEEKEKFLSWTIMYRIDFENERVSLYGDENGRDILILEDDDFEGTIEWLNTESKAKTKIYSDKIEIIF